MTPRETWTPEPWEVYDDRHIQERGGEHLAEACTDEDAARIVACVNACKGLADPERDVRELRGALRECVRWLEAVERRPGADVEALLERAHAVLAKTETK